MRIKEKCEEDEVSGGKESGEGGLRGQKKGVSERELGKKSQVKKEEV